MIDSITIKLITNLKNVPRKFYLPVDRLIWLADISVKNAKNTI